MSFTGIGGMPSTTTAEGDDTTGGVIDMFLLLRREGRDGMVGVRSGSTGSGGQVATGTPVDGAKS